MNRRSAIKTGGMALLGLGFGGCRTVSPLDSRQPRPRPALQLAPVRASWDRVLRTTVGLRPHRESGFVLRAEKLDAKTLIHNYGHAGAGMSLGWGCGVLAAEFALQTGARRAAVIGCGSPGLTAARQLQRRGFDVTIYAMTVPPDTTSNMSLAGFTPTTALIDKDRRTPAWDAQFLRVAETVLPRAAADGRPVLRRLLDGRLQRHRRSDARAGRGGGAAAAAGKAAGTTRPTPSCCPIRCGPIARANCSARASIRSRPSTRRARSRLSIEPSIYLDALVRDFLRVRRPHRHSQVRHAARSDVAAASRSSSTAPGLGSFTLFDDKELVPVKGQLTALVPQPEVDYRASGRTAERRQRDHERAQRRHHRRQPAGSRQLVARAGRGRAPAQRQRGDRVLLGDAAARAGRAADTFRDRRASRLRSTPSSTRSRESQHTCR